ncbi:MAG: hypothetical protein DRG78_15230 [Epsilonproteobacteria bacterium]|nr:MAG: hypothetical protein DRG78_15230 [Campylobacterota bacterium]
MYLIYSKGSKELVFTSGRYFEKNPTADEIWMNDGYSNKTHTLYFLNEKNPIQFMVAERINNGDMFTPQWNNDNVISISFDGEDAKPWLRMDADESDVNQNETRTITGTVLKAYKKTIDTDFNDVIRIALQTPYNMIYMKAKFVNGVCVHEFKPAAYGKYMLPAINYGMHAGEHNEFRIDKAVVFEAIYEV